MKTTKSRKTQYNGEITMIEFLKANSDLTTREIATALGRGMSSVNGQLPENSLNLYRRCGRVYRRRCYQGICNEISGQPIWYWRR